MRAYTDQEKIEAYLNRSLTAKEITLINFIIPYISKFIKTYTNRDWLGLEDEEEEPTAKLYDGSGSGKLYTDDFTALESVMLLDSLGAAYLTLDDEEDFVLYPLNDTVKEGIYLRNYRFPKSNASVEVTAIFNSGPVPEDIVTVATALCGIFYRKGVAGGIKQESIEGYSYSLGTMAEQDAEVKSLLDTLNMRRKLGL